MLARSAIIETELTRKSCAMAQRLVQRKIEQLVQDQAPAQPKIHGFMVYVPARVGVGSFPEKRLPRSCAG